MTSTIWPDPSLLRRAFDNPGILEATLSDLAATARLVRCEPGPLDLPSPCTPVPSWWLVREGWLSLGSQTSDGTFLPSRRIGPGEWLDVAGALSAPRTWVEQAVCQDAVELVGLPVQGLFSACATDPAFAQTFGRVMAGQVRHLKERMSDLTTVDVPIRLARWLLRHIGVDDPSAEPIRLVLEERKQTIAQQLGTTAETLSRTLRRLSETGILQVHRRELTVLDLPALHDLAHPPGLRRRAPASLKSHRSSLRRSSESITAAAH